MDETFAPLDDSPDVGPGVPPLEQGTADAGLPDGTDSGDSLAGDDEHRPDPTDPSYKYWQGSYTKSRQRDRQELGKVQGEHKQFSDVLRQFYTSDAYALDVLRQRFPQLATRLSLDGTASASPDAAGRPAGRLADELAQHLGDDLAFLAPRLGPVLERAIQSAIQGAVGPLHEQTRQSQQTARQAEEERMMAEMDSAHPGWEARYGTDMQQLDKFLASTQLSHPKYGNKYQLMLRLLDSDASRVEAARTMAQAGRNRLATGRTGSATQSNIDDRIRKATTDSEAFRLAAEAALAETRRRT